MGLLSGLFGGSKKTEGEKQLARLTQLQVENARMIKGGMTNPDFAAMVNEYLPRARSDFINGLNQMMTQDARNRARGGQGAFVNPERRDEALSSVKAQGFLDLNQAARDEVRNTLLQSSGMAAQGAGAAQAGAALESNRAQQKAQMISNLLSMGTSMVLGPMGGQMMGSLFGGMGGGGGGVGSFYPAPLTNRPASPGGIY